MEIEENEITINNLTEYIKELTKVRSNLEPGQNIYYRGQNSNFRLSNSNNFNTLPSLIRNEKYLKNEDKLINEFITKYPELFADCQNNFDFLALMQHHQLPTRLLDLTSNPLIALYFAVERSNEGTDKDSDNKDGKIFPFTNLYNPVQLVNSLKTDNLSLMEDELTLIKGNDRQFLKSPFSDEIEIESSLSRLNGDDRSQFLANLNLFYQSLNEINKKNNQTNWSNLYTKIINLESNYNISELFKSYDYFNKDASTKRLYHEIKKDIGDFEEIINPLELYVPKIVTPRIIDQRIKNQRGLFMFVPFVYNYKVTNNYYTTLTNHQEIEELTQTRINILRLLSTNEKNSKLITFIIPNKNKNSIRSELEGIGITASFVYPDPSHIANEISNNYLQ